jgi:hypothetical protein
MAQTGTEMNKKPLAIVSEMTVNEKKNGCRKVFFNYMGELYENCQYRADFSFKL